jgi:hypothetical protein
MQGCLTTSGTRRVQANRTLLKVKAKCWPACAPAYLERVELR